MANFIILNISVIRIICSRFMNSIHYKGFLLRVMITFQIQPCLWFFDFILKCMFYIHDSIFMNYKKSENKSFEDLWGLSDSQICFYKAGLAVGFLWYLKTIEYIWIIKFYFWNLETGHNHWRQWLYRYTSTEKISIMQTNFCSSYF